MNTSRIFPFTGRVVVFGVTAIGFVAIAPNHHLAKQKRTIPKLIQKMFKSVRLLPLARVLAKDRDACFAPYSAAPGAKAVVRLLYAHTSEINVDTAHGVEHSLHEAVVYRKNLNKLAFDFITKHQKLDVTIS